MQQGTHKWIVRDQEGRIFGPFSTQKILSQIEGGVYSGNEQVALYPGGSWISISQAPEFYDKLLDVLEAEVKDRPFKGSDSTKSTIDEGSQSLSKSTGRVFREVTEPDLQDRSTSQTTTEMDTKIEGQSRSHQSRKIQKTNDEIIELEDIGEFKTEARNRIMRVPMVLVTIGILAVILAWLLRPSAKVGQIHLLAPRKGQPAISIEKAREKTETAFKKIMRDRFSSYVSAENDLVEVLEGRPDDVWAGANLCTAYYRLWPYAYQDSGDLAAIKVVASSVMSRDPTGEWGAICQATLYLMESKSEIAANFIDTKLRSIEEKQDMAGVPRERNPYLFAMRGDIFFGVGNYEMAALYYRDAIDYLPQWLRLWVDEARAKAMRKEYAQAHDQFRKILEKDSSHPIAQVEMGALEFFQFNHEDTALELVHSALSSSEKLPRKIEARAHEVAARVYLKKGQKKKAKAESKLAFQMNSLSPSIQELANLVDSEGGNQIQLDCSEMRVRGDQRYKIGDYLGAQGEYRAALEKCPRDASAALFAGKSLWKLNQINEAIEMVKHATKADPKLVEGYLTLADFYSQRYDYVGAATALKNLQAVSSNSYEVYKGYAQIEMQRNSLRQAEQYAARAMKIYANDVDLIILFAEIKFKSQQLGEALQYVSQAIEIDSTNVRALALKCQLVAAIKGFKNGRLCALDLQRAFPYVAEYYIALGDISVTDQQYQEAEEAYKKALALDKNNKSAMMALGKVMQAVNHGTEALQSFTDAAVLDPSDPTPLYYAGMVYMGMNKYEAAYTQFVRAINANPRFPRIYFWAGQALLKKIPPEADEALAMANKEKTFNPDLPDGYILSAEANYVKKQYPACAADLQRAVAKGAQDSMTSVKMARCFRLSGNVDAALTFLRQAKLRESGNPDIYKELGDVFKTKGQYQEAIAAYEQYLILVPNAPDRTVIQNTIGEIRSR